MVCDCAAAGALLDAGEQNANLLRRSSTSIRSGNMNKVKDDDLPGQKLAQSAEVLQKQNQKVAESAEQLET